MNSLKAFLSSFVLVFLATQQAFAVESVIDFHQDGKTTQIHDDHSKRVRNFQINKGEKVHTAKAYGTMYLSFLASMIATEIWYCNKGWGKDIVTLDFKNTTDNEETPNCRQELYQMLKDPSMHAGIFAMTYTSLAFTNFADRKTAKILRRLLKSKAEKPIAILQSVWQSVGMGLGISVQTIINSTYNSPSLPECRTKIKEAALSKDSTVEEAMKSEVCLNAYDAFVSFESGTMSELTIAMYSLALSTVATIGVMTTVKMVGMVFLGASPQGWLFRGGLYVANGLIEFFDRAMETTVRKYYHINRSERLLENNVEDLIEHLNEYEKTKSLIGTKTIMVKSDTPVPRGNTYRYNKETVRNFSLLEDLESYNKNIDYRRRAKLNTFLDSQSRWKQKLSGISEAYTTYKEFLKTVIDIRNMRVQHGDMMAGTEHSYNPMTFVGLTKQEIEAKDVKLHLMTDSSNLFLGDHQKDLLIEAIQNMINGSENSGSAMFPNRINVRYHGLKLLKMTLKNLNEDDYESLRINLWLLKGYMQKFHGRTQYNRRDPRQQAVDVMKNALEGVNGMLPSTSYGLIQFEKNGMPGADPAEKTEEESADPAERVQRKRGLSISTEEVDVLKIHKHLEFTIGHSTHKLANLLFHSVCNPNQEMIYDYNSGDISKVTFPSMLKLAEGEDFSCLSSGKVSFPSTKAEEGLFEDHYYNPENGKVSRILINPALHSIYRKNGRDYLGLIDLLTSPETEIRWNSVEELNDYWEKDVVPGYLALMGKGKMNFQNFLVDEYKLFERDSGFVAYFLESDKAAVRPETLDPLSNISFRDRDLEVYYESIKAGQAFLDQIRTVQHLFKTIGIDNERSKYLSTYFDDLNILLNDLDVVSYTNLDPNDEYALEDVSINPLWQMVGQKKYFGMVMLNNKISAAFGELTAELEAYPDYDKESVDSLTEEDAKLILEKVAFKGLHSAYKDVVVDQIFKDYLTGNGYIYTEELDVEVNSGEYFKGGSEPLTEEDIIDTPNPSKALPNGDSIQQIPDSRPTLDVFGRPLQGVQNGGL